MPRSSQTEMVLRSLREGIRNGRYAPGKPLPSERKLVEELGVSRTTLRLALHRLVEEELLVQTPHHRPVVAAPESKTPQAKYVALWLWPAFEDYGASLIAKGVQKALRGTDFRLYIPDANGFDWEALIRNEESFLNAAAADPDAAGIVIWTVGGKRSLKAFQRLQASGKPFVFVDRLPPEGFDADFVGVDNVGASKAAIEWLVGLGHRRIAYISNQEPVSAVADRVAGYQLALADGGIEFDSELLIPLPVSDSEPTNRTADQVVEKLFALPDPPTAIACVNDVVAVMVHDALLRSGRSIPGDISIVGFDGLLRWLPGGGFLTTVDQPFERIGEQAGRLLLRRITEPKAYPARHVLLDAPLRDQKSAKRLEWAFSRSG